jgi:hypothetical protein
MSVGEGPPGSHYPRLPFWDTVGLSYTTYFGNFIDALRASSLWLITVAVLTGVANWQQWSWMRMVFANADSVAKSHPGALAGMSSPFGTMFLLEFDHAFVLLAGVSIAVAWHRLMILGERPGFSGYNLATKNVWHYVAVGLALALIVFLPIAAIILPIFYLLPPVEAATPVPAGFLPLMLLIFIAYAVGSVVALRLSLLLPARAVGDTRLTFRQAWERSRGNFWRLFWGIALTTIPPLLAIQIAFLLLSGFPVRGLPGSEDFVAQMTATGIIFTIYYLLITPIGIGFLSHAYRHFFQREPEIAD